MYCIQVLYVCYVCILYVSHLILVSVSNELHLVLKLSVDTKLVINHN